MAGRKHTTDLIIREFNDQPVAQRPQDSYINATHLCRAAGKQWSNYRQNQATEEFLSELSGSLGIPRDVLIQAVTTGPNDQRGTWVHPRVAYHLGQWCSPKAAVQVTAWLEELHTTGTVSLGPSRALTTAEMFLAQAQINVEFEQRTAAIEARQEEQALQIAALVERQSPSGKLRIEDWLRRQSKPFLPKPVLTHLRAACRDLENPEMFRPENYDYPCAYFSPYTIASAYDQVTRQLSFFSREAAQGYHRN